MFNFLIRDVYENKKSHVFNYFHIWEKLVIEGFYPTFSICLLDLLGMNNTCGMLGLFLEEYNPPFKNWNLSLNDNNLKISQSVDMISNM